VNPAAAVHDQDMDLAAPLADLAADIPDLHHEQEGVALSVSRYLKSV
jgi:hypothetical protein